MMLLKAFGGALVTFLVVDALWIGLVVRNLYQRDVGHLLSDNPSMAAAGAFYVFYVVGIVWLAVLPALDAGSARVALINGAVLGAVAYGTFTVTNFAVLKGWTTSLVVTDIAWGIVITAISAALGYLSAQT